MFLRMYIQVSLEKERQPAFKINDNKPRILKQTKKEKKKSTGEIKHA